MNLQKLLKIVAIVIGVISIFFLGRLYLQGMKLLKQAKQGTIRFFMNVSYVILAIAVLIVLVFQYLT